MTTDEFFHHYESEQLSGALLEDLRDTCVIRHPYFAAAQQTVLNHVAMGNPKRLLLVIGGAGTGKTTLSKAVEWQVAHWSDKQDDVLPPIWVEAPPPEGSSYSFRPFYEELLHGMKEPLPGYKVDPAEARDRRKKKNGTRAIRSTSGARQYVNVELRQKSVPVILVDEAQHFGRSTNLNERIGSMDVIKSITEMNQTKMVFFGTHDALSLENLNGQLSRRIKTIHFMPYELDEKGHKEFFNTYASICTEVKLPIDVGREHSVFLHENTLGAVGLLSQWIDEAAQVAISNDDNVVTLDHLADTLPTEITLDLIQKEIAEYSKLKKARHRRVRKQLKKANKKYRPGRRKPTTRDPAGSALR